jgi:ADP-ribose pyrophosphatase
MELPAIEIAVVDDADRGQSGDFLSVRHLRLVARYPSGKTSEPFPYAIVRRRALDAVVIVAHFTGEDGRRRVYLRSCVRPPLLLRDIPPQVSPELWETPAGLVEPGEAPRAAAARELSEELGITLPEESLHELGPWAFPVPGFIGERHLFFHAEVDPRARTTPTEDGSPLEREARIIDLPVSDVLALAREGKLRDSKTELALRRLSELFP